MWGRQSRKDRAVPMFCWSWGPTAYLQGHVGYREGEIQVAPPSKPARARGTPGTRVPVCVRGEHVVTEEESASVGAPVHVHKLHRNRALSRT